jgi:hypothetical protein
VRPAAEIHEAVVLVDRDLVFAHLFVELLDLIHFVRLLALAEELERLGHAHVAMLERHVGLRHLAHLLLDLREVVGLERARQLEVVIEAVGDRRAEPELRVGDQLEDGPGHDMRGRVTKRVELLVTVVGLPFRLRHGHLLICGQTKSALVLALRDERRCCAPAVPPEFPIPRALV